MAVKTVSKEINGKNVTIVLLGAKEGLKMATKLSKVALPTVSKFFEQKGKIVLSQYVPEVVEKLEDLELEDMTVKLFNQATVNDFPIDVDAYFAGNYGEYVDFMAFALEANFKSFFDVSIFKNQN